jgi:hypothetical protein
MNVRKITSDTGFGLARMKPEGATIVAIGDCDVTFYSGELDFLGAIPRLSNKSKDKIIREFAQLAAEAGGVI